MAVSIEQLPFDLVSFERAEQARINERKQAIKALQDGFVNKTEVNRWRLRPRLNRLKDLPARPNRHLVVIP